MRFVTQLKSDGVTWYASRYIRLAKLTMPTQTIEALAQTSNRGSQRMTDRSPSSNFTLAAIIVSVVVCVTVYVFQLSEAMRLGEAWAIQHIAFLTIAALAFAWIVFHTANMIVGALATLSKGGRDSIALQTSPRPSRNKTALLFPIYHEGLDDVARRIEDVIRGAEQCGVSHAYDVFVLSDSNDPDVIQSEKRRFGSLSRKFQSDISLSYRNRAVNSGKKAGNIANWVTKFGSRHEYFVVFDADSIITPHCLQSLVTTMDCNPTVGLIQTFPRISGSRTRFSRMQQFANNLYGPISASGLIAWQGTSGNYWGHNAIVRTRAFAETAGLPVLPGAPPWGGHIRSHDFVEAALLHRAGWRVELVTSLAGSLEASPPNVIELAARDRRWMQGNLQHWRFLFMRGLPAINRLHMALGIFGYVASALWLAMLSLGLVLLWQTPDTPHSYFPDYKTLFPAWPKFDSEASLRIFAATLGVLFLPKAIGLIFGLVEQSRHGSRWRRLPKFFGLWLAELITSVLMAPVYMLLHVRGLFEVLLGLDSGWASQAREGRPISLREAFKFHQAHIVFGLLLVLVSLCHSVSTALWLSPLIIGLLASPFVTSYLACCCPRCSAGSMVARTKT